MSLVYVDRSVQKDWLPLDQHGRSRDHHGSGSEWDAAQNEMGPKGYSEDFLLDARKFDSGGKPNPILLPMLRASLEEVVKLDLSQVQIQLAELMEFLLEWAKRKGFTLTPGSHASHLVGLRHPNLTPKQMLDACSALQEEGIHIAVRCGAFRVSPYVDTTLGDIEMLIEALERHIER
jgi:selenocysteine lyase/cysteine desulfurase